MLALLSALLNGLILSAGLTVSVWLALRLIPRRCLNAATRYVVWWITLGAVVAIPIAFLPLPRPRTVAPAVHITASAPAARFATPAYVPPPSVPPPSAAIPIHFQKPSTPWPWWPLYLWPVVSMLLITRLAISYIRLNRLKGRACRVDHPAVQGWITRCAGRRDGIRMVLSREISTPIAAGPGRPTILIPERLFEQLTEDDFDRIGLHETAHLVRRDDYALLLQRIIEALLIPSPLIFWIARHIDLEREIACDDLVIAATGRPRSYADCLARIVEASDTPCSPWPAAAAAEDGSQLARRVDALLDKTRRAGAHLMRLRLVAATTLLLTLAIMAARTPALVAFVATAAAAPYRALRRAIPVRPLPAQTQAAQAEELAGQVMEDNTGRAVAAAELRFRKAGMRELAADLETDREGRFAAGGLPSGQYTVEVVKPNYIATSFQLTVPAPHVTVRLVHYGVIDGSVRNASGDPLPALIRAPGGRTIGSARIAILTKDPVSGQLSTFREGMPEEGGHYRIYDLPPGKYAIGFWYSGQNEGAGVQLYPDNTNPRFFPIAGGEEYDHIDFTVVPKPSARISGRIQLPDGVKGQFQLALGLPDQPNIALAQTLSEKDGTFQFEKIPPGSYELFAGGPVGGYGMYDSILDDKVGSFFGRTLLQSSGQSIENISLEVAPGKIMRLVVKAKGSTSLPEGCPASVKVELTSLEPWGLMFFTNSEVSFGKEENIPKMAPGLFRIAATNPGKACFQENDAVADLRGDSPEPVVIELVAAGSIRGILKGASSGTVVRLNVLGGASADQPRVAFSDSAGRFSFESLRPGRYKIAGKEIEVRSGAPTDVEVDQ